MAKPWEKYQATEAEQPAEVKKKPWQTMPWEKYQQPEKDITQTSPLAAVIAGVGEPALEGVTSAAGQLIGGGTEIAGRNLGMIPEGDYGKTTRNIQEAMTYEPRTVAGKKVSDYLGSTVGAVVSPVVEKSGNALSWLAKQAGMGEGFQEVAQQTPEAALNVLGLKATKFGAGKTAEAAKYTWKEGVKMGSEAYKPADQAIQSAKGTPYVAIIDDAGKIEPNIIEATKQIRATDAKSPLANFKDALSVPELEKHNKIVEATGVPSMKGQITGRADDAVELIDLLKESNQASYQLAAQHEGLVSNLHGTVDNLKPTTQSLEQASTNARSAAVDTIGDADNAMHQAYLDAEAKAPKQKTISLEKYTDLLSKKRLGVVGDPTLTRALLSELKDIGVLDSKGKLIGKIDARTAEGVRQTLNQAYTSTSPVGKGLIHDLKEALDTDTINTSGMPEVFEGARQKTIAAKALRKKQGIDKYDEYGKSQSIVNDILTNKIPEEKVAERIIGARDSEFNKAHEFYTKDAGASGMQAWNDMGAEYLRRAIDKSTIKNQEGGGVAINNYQLKKNLAPLFTQDGKYNFNAKAKAMYDEATLSRLKTMIDAGDLLMPKRQLTGLGSGPTGLAVNKALMNMLKQTANQPVLDIGKAGYESLKGDARLSNQLGHIDRYTNLVQRNRKLLKNVKVEK